MRWLLALLAAASPAFAEDEPLTTYHLPLVAADTVSLAAVVVPLTFDGSLDEDVTLWTARAGVAALAVSGSIVHATYGEYDRALGSVLLRGAGAALGAGIGRLVPCDGDLCADDQTAIGAVIGVSAAMLFEVIWMADKPAPKPRTAWLPYVGGAELGVAGRF